MLWRIADAGYFTALSIHETNAHGHAQIFGWLGLFLMGFAYAVCPRLWGRPLPYPKLMLAVFAAMLTGILIRAFAMPFPGVDGAVTMVLVGGTLQIAAIIGFTCHMLAAFRQSMSPLEPWTGFIFVAMAWFGIIGIASLWHAVAIMTAANRHDLLWQVATYQASLRDMQFHGLVLTMMLGFSLRLLPETLGVARTSDRRTWFALGLLTAAVIAEVVLMLAFRFTHNRAFAMALMGPWVLVIVSVFMVVQPWRLWRAPPRRESSAKFLRAAYLWLAIALAMLLLLPVHQWLSDLPFSHAYYGAIRHAFAVGFASMAIMGLAMKVIPALDTRPGNRAGNLWVPFVLINAGCAMRVGLQTATDWHSEAFTLIGISSMLELSALTWWGLHMIRRMWRSKPGVRPDAQAPRRQPRVNQRLTRWNIPHVR